MAIFQPISEIKPFWILLQQEMMEVR